MGKVLKKNGVEFHANEENNKFLTEVFNPKETKLVLSFLKILQDERALNIFIMKNFNKNFINGEWIVSNGNEKVSVINPSNEKLICDITLSNKEELDLAVFAEKNIIFLIFYWKIE